MVAMQKMQPELQRIQKLYANDKMRLQMEMMKLYQTHKTTPMSGCLPMLIQLPIMLLIGVNIWLLIAAKLPDWIEIIMAAICLIIYSVAKLLLAYQSTFTDSLKTVLHNCLIIGVGRFLPVLGMGLADILSFCIAFFLLFTTPPLMAIVPGIALFFYSVLSRKVFKRYMPTTSYDVEEENT